MPRFYGNRAQSAARARREEQARKDRLLYKQDLEESKKWERAEGPLPADVWENSDVIAAFGRTDSGIVSNHVRSYKGDSSSLYLQYAYYPGWRFCVVIRKDVQE